MRFLFWNTHNTKDINSILCGMIVEQKANIVILAEYEDIIEDLIYNLDLKGVRMNVYPSIGCDRLIILGNTKDIRQSRQSKYYSMQIIKNDMLLCGVHLPSQMWADERTQTLAFQSVVRDIELAEEDGGIDKTIVVGDLIKTHMMTDVWVHADFMESPLQMRHKKYQEQSLELRIKCFTIQCGIYWAILVIHQELTIIEALKRKMNFGIFLIK